MSRISPSYSKDMKRIQSDLERLDTGFQKIKKGEAAANKEMFTKADADLAIAELRKHLPDWVGLELKGSVAEKGQSDKDIDIIVTFNYANAPQGSSGAALLARALEKMNAPFVRHGENGSDWHDWNGLILDIHTPDNVDSVLSSTRYPALTRLLGKKFR